MSRKKIVAGNWKMNLLWPEAQELTTNLIEQIREQNLDDKSLIVCPPMPYIVSIRKIIENAGLTNLEVGAQNCHFERKGAYTGEVAPQMLPSLNVPYTLVGHSERRSQFQESHEMLRLKVQEALSVGLKVIFCCGEELAEREAKQHYNIIESQLTESLFFLNAEDLKNVIIAYEPVWAIGTGVTASPEQAEDMHAFIRSTLNAKYGQEAAENMTILYGGSCKPTNAEALFSQPNIDGGLIGGASLKAEDFLAIARHI